MQLKLLVRRRQETTSITRRQVETLLNTFSFSTYMIYRGFDIRQQLLVYTTGLLTNNKIIQTKRIKSSFLFLPKTFAENESNV